MKSLVKNATIHLLGYDDDRKKKEMLARSKTYYSKERVHVSYYFEHELQECRKIYLTRYESPGWKETLYLFLSFAHVKNNKALLKIAFNRKKAYDLP